MINLPIMIQVPFTPPKRYIHCPACGKGEHLVSHLAPGTKTAWYCDDRACGKRFSVKVISADSIECEVLEERRIETNVLLRCFRPFSILVRGNRFEPNMSGKTEAEDCKYFYEESTCPINVLGAAIEVYDVNGNVDPHNIFRFVTSEDATE